MRCTDVILRYVVVYLQVRFLDLKIWCSAYLSLSLPWLSAISSPRQWSQHWQTCCII